MYEWYRASRSGRVVIVVALCLLCSGRAFCPHVSAGIIGGGALTNDFVPLDVSSTPYREYSRSKDYMVGPMLAVSIPANFSLEADALYRPRTSPVQRDCQVEESVVPRRLL